MASPYVLYTFQCGFFQTLDPSPGNGIPWDTPSHHEDLFLGPTLEQQAAMVTDGLRGKNVLISVWGSRPCLVEEWEELVIKNHPGAGSRMLQDDRC